MSEPRTRSCKYKLPAVPSLTEVLTSGVYGEKGKAVGGRQAKKFGEEGKGRSVKGMAV